MRNILTYSEYNNRKHTLSQKMTQNNVEKQEASIVI